MNLVEPSSRRSFGSSRSSNTLDTARWNNLAEQFCEAFLLQAGAWGEFEVLGTEPVLSAIEQERPVRSANIAPRPAPPPETRDQRHERAETSEFVELEALGEPYYVWLICETPFRSRSD